MPHSKAECQKKNPELWNFLNQKSNKVEEITVLSSQGMIRWVEELIKNHGLKISGPALRKLIFYTGSNPQNIAQEIDKLICYRRSGTISDDDVELLVTKYENINSFAIVDAICNRQKAKAIELLHRYLLKGEDPQLLFGALIYQFRNIILIRSMIDDRIQFAEFSKKLNLHPFVLRKSYDMAKKFDSKDLENSFNKLTEIEKDTKSGINDINSGIFDFILTIQ